LRGKPGGKDFRNLMFIIRRLFPRHQLYLLNGLLHKDEEVVSFCADRIRFINSCQPAVIFICEKFAEVEHRKHIKKILFSTISWLNNSKRSEVVPKKLDNVISF
jgi:hypothetical protein